jgi:hypothetical protein
MPITRYTVSLYLYDEPVLETYWTDFIAAEKFCHKIMQRRAVRMVLIWRGEGKGGEWNETLANDADLLYYESKR